ncbi:MAG: hypothetical protein ONB44_12190 [candidate division KSB1 bacterium]|nr:hypothetical protein [candidate division KSB1 bacterium]MDZ7302880.1 hypothetical protein [candidate division KSB1 bacterium]MDZ7310456.1 hypothetical protein [candidate division KSB1 bacterium]
MSIRRTADHENFIIRHCDIMEHGAERPESLAALISPQQRRKFVEKLFRNDALGFEELLNQLESAPDWRVAHRLIESYFASYRINPYQQEAICFSNLVYKRYFPKDEYV